MQRLPTEVLEDICWPLTRTDLETLLVTDHAWSVVVADSFASAGPLRAVFHATLNNDGLKCRFGDEEEKLFENPTGFGSCLRNTTISTLSVDCSEELNAAATESLKAVKGKYLLESLHLRRVTTEAEPTVLKDDVFTCKLLSCGFNYWPFSDESEEEGDENGGTEGDEEGKDAPKSGPSPAEIMASLLNANTVKQVNYLVLTEMPPCDAELIADWLHYGNGQPRNMQIWWDCTGENELDALKLVNILKERFLGATSPQTYEFYAGAERFESYDVRNARLENACGEVLKVESTQTCYSDVRVTRFPK